MGRCGCAISGARKRLPDMGDACFGSNSAVAGRRADHNLSRIRLIKRAPSLNDRALEAFIRLTQCASKRALYCASSRSSLCTATHTRRSGTSMWSATRPGSLAEALAALRSAVCRCGPSRDVMTAGLRVLSIQTSRLERPYLPRFSVLMECASLWNVSCSWRAHVPDYQVVLVDEPSDFFHNIAVLQRVACTRAES
jgi:hypothetical protein